MSACNATSAPAQKQFSTIPSKPLTQDRAQAELFVNILGRGEETIFTWQIFPERPESRVHPKVLHCTLDEAWQTLVMANNDGAGVFVMVNRGDGVIYPGAASCRTNANVVAIRATFVDLDHAPIEPLLETAEPPHFTVNSSPERWHAYWCTDEIALPEFKVIQLALAKRFNGDPVVCDLARVMRLPGFIHWKAEPFTSRLVHPR